MEDYPSAFDLRCRDRSRSCGCKKKSAKNRQSLVREMKIKSDQIELWVLNASLCKFIGIKYLKLQVLQPCTSNDTHFSTQNASKFTVVNNLHAWNVNTATRTVTHAMGQVLSLKQMSSDKREEHWVPCLILKEFRPQRPLRHGSNCYSNI